MTHQAFIDMLRIRRIEEKIIAEYPKQKMRCPVHLSIGQEAVAVGVCRQLHNNEGVVSGHRAHAHYLAKGGNLRSMVAEMHGKAAGCCQGRGGSMHLIDLSCHMLGSTPIVGGTLPVAVGLSFAGFLRKSPQVMAVFFGEGCTEEGVFAESLNFAALKSLPVLFVCENNLYSVYSPLHVRQPLQRNLLQIAQGHGVEPFSCDGNDVEAVGGAAQEALAHVRSGQGPAFLLCTTYRYREHCGPNCDDHLGYRPAGELQQWMEKCPLKQYELRYSLPDRGEWEKAIALEIEEAFQFAESAPWPEDRGHFE